jgi:DTW domain-containing protein YfiP
LARLARSDARKGANRCNDCRLQRTVCVCALLPTLPTQTRVVLLLHQLELRKPTNTGRLALRCLPNSRFALRGRADEDPGAPALAPSLAPPDWLDTATRPVLLFPSEDSVPLGSLVDSNLRDPVTLIVPDGTWSQAARTRKRFPGLSAVPCAHLPLDLVSTYRLRHDPRPGHLSTLQAIAHAIGILESPAVAEQLLHVHRIAIERTLYTKGQLPADEVTGGIPD